jgi:hypothetical protein
LANELLARAVPPLDALVDLPRGSYIIGEPGEERTVALERVLFGRWPVVNAHLGEEPMTDRPALIDALREVDGPCCADRGNLAWLHGIDVEAKKTELGLDG